MDNLGNDTSDSREFINLKLLKVNMFEDYLAGFFDGEGSLILRLKKDPRYKLGYQIELHTNITQKDRNVLEMIQKKFGFGKIYFHKRDELWHYNIYKISEIKKFVSAIKGRVVVKKERLEKFDKCLNIIISKKHLSNNGVKKIMGIWSAPETEDNPR